MDWGALTEGEWASPTTLNRARPVTPCSLLRARVDWGAITEGEWAPPTTLNRARPVTPCSLLRARVDGGALIEGEWAELRIHIFLYFEAFLSMP